MLPVVWPLHVKKQLMMFSHTRFHSIRMALQEAETRFDFSLSFALDFRSLRPRVATDGLRHVCCGTLPAM